jgi:GNAT superfamily N-acetyltransferase
VPVRRGTPEDARVVAEVHVRSWQEAYPGLVPQDYLDALSVDERARQWARMLADTDWPRRGTFVLEDGAGAVSGFVHLRPSEDEDAVDGVGEVAALYLRAHTWGRGGGRALIGAALTEFARAGWTTATLWVLGTNDRARRFYERCGWAPDGGEKVHDWVAFVADDVRYRIEVPAAGAPGPDAEDGATGVGEP